MEKDEYKIIAYLKDNETGCKPSAHFKEHFIENDKLHPDVKAIPIEQEIAFADEAEVQLLKNNVPIKTLKGNELLRPDLFQEFILEAQK